MAAGVALAGSLYLAWASLRGGEVPGCSGGVLDCERVLSSRWSQWLGIPVAALAIGLYGSLLAASMFTGRLAARVGAESSGRLISLAAGVVAALAATAAAAALWFTALQLFVLGQFCWICLLVHACAGLLAVLTAMAVARLRRDRQKTIAGSATGPLPGAISLAPRLSIGIAAAAVVLLAAGQLLVEPKQYQARRFPPLPARAADAASAEPRGSAPPADADSAQTASGPPSPPLTPLVRWVEVPNSPTRLDTYAEPILGRPDAPYVLVELFDYTCRHCRELHEQLEAAREAYGERLAILALPLPMNPACNQHSAPAGDGPHRQACLYARAALAVWNVDQTKFTEFHHWLMTGREPPPFDAARERAIQLIGAAAFHRQWSGWQSSEQIGRNVAIYRDVQLGRIPKLMSGDVVLDGQYASARQLVEVIERQFGWPVPARPAP